MNKTCAKLYPKHCDICQWTSLCLGYIINSSNETQQHTRATAKGENEVAKAHQRHQHNIG